MSSSGNPLTRQHLDILPSYQPGRRPQQVANELGIPQALKLSANELPFGPLPGVAEAVADAAAQLHRYPDMFSIGLREALAQRHKVSPTQIVTGCGSVALCEHLALVTAAPGSEIVFGWRSFEAYPIIVSGLDAIPIRVPNTTDHRLDIEGIVAAVTPRTALIFLCTPNNPTGTAVCDDELRHLLASVPENVLVVIDEAYREFVTDEAVPDGLTLLADHPNLVVLRTFSKAWGLAGVRLGYLVGTAAVADAVGKVLTPFSTSALAQAAGLAALQQHVESARRVGIIVRERERVLPQLRKYVPELPDSQANFCWLPVGGRTRDLAAAFEAQGVIVRSFGAASPDVAPYAGIRISIGSPAENTVLLGAAAVVFGD
ncbi:MAG: histidinol-phosphate transaminase [Acidimicrobiales bacterium]|nr:MAG: histidinol-phosphate transaminase [Acidimicrobiales bacterium]